MDSEPIVQEQKAVIQPTQPQKKISHLNTIVNIIIKILSFAFITSDIFKDNILFMFPSTLKGGDVLLSGMLFQAILLILVWYAIEKYL